MSGRRPPNGIGECERCGASFFRYPGPKRLYCNDCIKAKDIERVRNRRLSRYDRSNDATSKRSA